jgi:hypothetical protein
MTMPLSYVIKTPEAEAEFRSLWRLNHEVFAEEYPQHPTAPNSLLIDKFHGKNIYRIAWDGHHVLGMLSAHWQAPFSAVQKFGAVMEPYIIPQKTAEIRLLALRRENRGGSLAVRLGIAIMEELSRQGMERLLISAIDAQVAFYKHVGFRLIGAPVIENGLLFHPMVGDLADILYRHEPLRHSMNMDV